MYWSIYFCLLIFNIHQSFATFDDTVDTFEFGINVGRVVFSFSGSIDIWPHNKITRIPIVLPPCIRLTYVNVSVDNAHGPPAVSFDMDIQVVTVKYRKLQHSKSTYVITAKGVPDRNCR